MTSPHDPAREPRRRRWRWHAAFWPVAACAAIAAAAALDRVGTALYDEHVAWLGARVDSVSQGLERIYDVDPAAPKLGVAYFGDSTVANYDEGPSLPVLTTAALNRARGRPWVKMLNASAPGSGVEQYAFLADEVASFEPDLVIWQLSLFHFTDRWNEQYGAPELVGWVHAERLPEILAMPFERFRLSLADVLLQQAIVRLGLHDVQRRVREAQLRFAHVTDAAEDVLNPNRGRKPEARAQSLRGRGMIARLMARRGRYSAYGERLHFGRTLDGLEPDDPQLRLLRSGIRALTARGVDVLVYLNPANFEYLREVGEYDEDGLARSIAEIRRAAEESGAHFLDLHALLSDADFRDAPGHFVDDEARTVPLRITGEIARAALPILTARERASERGGEGAP